MRRALLMLASLTAVLALYVGTFSFWWLTSPTRLEDFQRRRVRTVEFQFNSVSWRTEPFWAPAFWFMERVIGYEPGGLAAMEDHSILIYVSRLP